MEKSTDIALHLGKASLFANIDFSNLRELAKLCQTKIYQKGSEIVKNSQLCNGFHYVSEGEIKLYFLSTNGEEKSAGVVLKGGTFGEVNLFMKNPLPIYGKTKKKTTLIYIPRSPLLELLNNSPLAAMQMMTLLSRRLYSMTQELEQLCTLNAHERVMHFIASELTKNTPGDHYVQLSETKAEVASSLHLTPETFSRIIHTLENEGTIHIRGKEIHVRDKHKLNMN